MLEGNVRSFLTAKGKVNSGIRRTIINDPAMFFAYNNGIATTAESIQTENIDGNEYITFVKDLQIVNGGQTTVSLANALTKDKKVANDLANIFVPMKLSVVSPEDAKKLIPDIAKYANRQNKVSDADLTSNHEFHRMFSDYAQTTPAPAKEGFQKETYWYYERAKGQYKQDIAQKKGLELTQFEKQHPRNQIITKTDLGKYANIWRKLPNVVVLGSDKNYKNFASWALPEDEDEWAKLKPQFDNADFFKRMVAIAILYKAVDKDVKNQSWYEMGYKAQTVVYALDKLLYQISSQFPGNDLDYMRIWDLQDVPAGVMKEISEIAEQVYHVLTAADRPIDNVTEWAKRSACWDRIKELPSSLPETFAQYVKKVNVSRPQKAPKPGFRKKPNEMEKLRASVDAGKATEKNPKLWESLYQWGQDEQAISPSDLNLVNRMRLRRVLSNGIEYFTLMEILKESRDRGFLG